MPNAVIVDAARTPVARRNGKFKDIHPVDLASIPLKALVERNDFDPGLVEDVIMGCVMQTGEQGLNIGRNAALAAGFPEDVVGTTIDRQCGSSQQSAHFAAQGVMAGAYDVVIAAGIESMTRIPMGITAEQGPGMPFGPQMLDRYSQGLVPQGISAEMIAEKWSISREELDELSLGSHQRAARATTEGRFETQIVPVEVTLEDGATETVVRDEGIRWDTSLEKLASLQPAFKADGVVTAGNSSQISDGAAAVVVANGEAAEAAGSPILAEILAYGQTGGVDATLHERPAEALLIALKRAGLEPSDLDLVEINEAFAAVALWSARMLDIPESKVNVNGGAVALGHPLGATGARIVVTLVNALRHRGGGVGAAALCGGGGQGDAIVVRVDS